MTLPILYLHYSVWLACSICERAMATYVKLGQAVLCFFSSSFYHCTWYSERDHIWHTLFYLVLITAERKCCTKQRRWPWLAGPMPKPACPFEKDLTCEWSPPPSFYKGKLPVDEREWGRGWWYWGFLKETLRTLSMLIQSESSLMLCKSRKQ